jgi:surfeit locus 1 family protein
MTLACLIALGILLFLGTWQLNRLSWKEQLIADVTERLEVKTIAAPGPKDWDAITRKSHAYSRVRISGHYDHSREVHVWFALKDPKGGPLFGPGYLILTRFITKEGWEVIVNRGFVPEGMKEADSRPITLSEGEQVITGLMRFDEPRSWLSPPADTIKNVWIVRQVWEMAQFLGLENEKTAPYWIDLTKGQGEAGLPQGGETRVVFTNNHMQYLLTWYGLALVLVCVYGAWLLKRRRLIAAQRRA